MQTNADFLEVGTEYGSDELVFIALISSSDQCRNTE
jgi:hypothetical protein